VAGTFSSKQLLEVVTRSLFVAGCVYRRRRDGDLQFDGVRPGDRWIAHGYCSRRLWMLDGVRLVRRRLWKRRWLDPEMGETCHSRPPDDAAQVWSCTLIVALKLWAWLDAREGGASGAPEILDVLEEHAHVCTVARWLHRAAARALEIEQAIRHAVIERSEPRPVELLFPAGLSPPEELLRRRWRCDPSDIASLWRALAFLFGGAIRLSVPAACLLAEARGRMSAHESSFPI